MDRGRAANTRREQAHLAEIERLCGRLAGRGVDLGRLEAVRLRLAASLLSSVKLYPSTKKPRNFISNFYIVLSEIRLLRKKEHGMRLHASCRKCGQLMRCVADIPPTACDPGLSGYLCTRCGHTTSTLVYAHGDGRRVPIVRSASAESVNVPV